MGEASYEYEYDAPGEAYRIKSVSRVPAQRLKAGSHWNGHRIEFVTELFGKEYYWMRDPEGTTYLAKIGSDGVPIF